METIETFMLLRNCHFKKGRIICEYELLYIVVELHDILLIADLSWQIPILIKHLNEFGRVHRLLIYLPRKIRFKADKMLFKIFINN